MEVGEENIKKNKNNNKLIKWKRDKATCYFSLFWNGGYNLNNNPFGIKQIFIHQGWKFEFGE